MIRLIAAAAAGILIAVIGAYVAKNVLHPGAGNTAANTAANTAVTMYDGN